VRNHLVEHLLHLGGKRFGEVHVQDVAGALSHRAEYLELEVLRCSGAFGLGREGNVEDAIWTRDCDVAL
jgi:hypothetical protein